MKKKGRSQCFSAKRHNMRTRSSKVGESIPLQENSSFSKKGEDQKVGNSKSDKEASLHEDETVVVDIEGNSLVWNLEEEIARVIENRVALGFDFNGKEKTSTLIPLPPDLSVFYPSCLLSSHTQSQSLDSLQWRLLNSLDSKGDNGCLRLVTRFTRLVSFVDLLALVNLQDWFASSS
ncbi:hypothetical protein LWI29_016637 [Acer saccharum]|uniref:Uncharacterized protein n=1 Tax=Acer saccharum TaxID=4024 RepID=A0AA39UTN5_ACESA|nr:hypothetical protein LWI29_016637 [Acer saccharum]